MARFVAVVVALLPTMPAAAQDAPMSSGTATVFVEGRQPASAGFSLAVDGPRFALQPLAAAFGVRVDIGPLGERYTLTIDGTQFTVGPESSRIVIVDAAGGQQLVSLAGAPLRDAAGLKVPMDFLERTFGAELGYYFVWRPETLELYAERSTLRELEARITVIHQFRLSTVEVLFSAQPRYRVERPPGALELRFTGDSLRRVGQPPTVDDPLVRRIEVRPQMLRLELAPNAAADEPRLVAAGGVARLVIEVFERADETVTLEDEQSLPRAPIDRPGVHTIVIDPGHGGSETGAIGKSGTAEKDLNLLIARALERQLERRLPVRVELTREQDVDLAHESRTAFANQNHADLFISLHFNSSYGPSARGAETYFLSREASDQLAADAAARENRRGDGGSAQRGLQMILWDLAQTHHLAESQRFATLVQEELNQALGLRDRGVKQAPFRVLMGAMMPAVLVELGFLSNPEEESKLQSASYRAELVDALVDAVIRFKRQQETRPEDGEAP